MKKEIYKTPKMEVVEFDEEDVITTSGGCTDLAQTSQSRDCELGYAFSADGGCTTSYLQDIDFPCFDPQVFGYSR